MLYNGALYNIINQVGVAIMQTKRESNTDTNEFEVRPKRRKTASRLSDLVSDLNVHKGNLFVKSALQQSSPFFPSRLFTTTDYFLPIGKALSNSLSEVALHEATTVRLETVKKFQTALDQFQEDNNSKDLLKGKYLYAELLLVLTQFYSNCAVKAQEKKLTAKNARERGYYVKDQKDYLGYVAHYSAEIFNTLNSIIDLCDEDLKDDAERINTEYSTMIDRINSSREEDFTHCKKLGNTSYSDSQRLMPAPKAKPSENHNVSSENSLTLS